MGGLVCGLVGAKHRTAHSNDFNDAAVSYQFSSNFWIKFAMYMCSSPLPMRCIATSTTSATGVCFVITAGSDRAPGTKGCGLGDA